MFEKFLKNILFCFILLTLFSSNAEAFLNPWADWGEKYELNDRVNATEKLLESKKYRLAYRIADKLSRIDPTFGKPFMIKAVAAMNLNKYEDALENINYAMKNNDNPYPTDLYGYKFNILYHLAYPDKKAPNYEYIKEFNDELRNITGYYSTDYSDFGELEELTEYITTFTINSDIPVEYKVETLLSLMENDLIYELRYDNPLYFGLCAVALKIAIVASDKEYAKTGVQKGEIIFKIDNFAGEEPFYYDFTDYLRFKFSLDEDNEKKKLKQITDNISAGKVYKDKFLPEEKIKAVEEFEKRFDSRIMKHKK